MRYLLKLDWVLLVVVLLLVSLGFIALYSLSFTGSVFNPAHLQKQTAAILIGLGLMFALAFYDYQALSFYSTKIYFGLLIVLLGVLAFGTKVRGTTGWVDFNGVSFQPVEVAKVVMIIFLASFLSKKKTELSIWVRTIASIVLVSLPVFLILRQPDFGSAAVIIGIWFIMLLVSGIDKKTIFALILAGLTLLFSGWFVLKDYQKERLKNFVTPYNDPKGTGYNVIQSIVAVGSGGVWGKGLGHGSQSQLNFLPEKRTDFIFAVIAEELGLVGSLVVFVLFGVLFYRMREIARLARNNFGYLLVVGVMAMLFFHVFVNIGMNIGIAPVAGVPLPFLSYGGSSMIAVLAAIGILQSVYIRRMKNT